MGEFCDFDVLSTSKGHLTEEKVFVFLHVCHLSVCMGGGGGGGSSAVYYGLDMSL